MTTGICTGTQRVLWWLHRLAEDHKGGFCGHWGSMIVVMASQSTLWDVNDLIYQLFRVKMWNLVNFHLVKVSLCSRSMWVNYQKCVWKICFEQKRSPETKRDIDG